jgi:cytochrome c
MGDLFWNKVAGAVLAVGLLILGLQTLGHELMDSESAEPETIAYPVNWDLVGGAMTSDEPEEPAGPPDFGTLLASADISAGERVARRCASCHSFDASGRNGTGPALYEVMGRDVGGVDGFRYSGAMLEYAEGGTEWMYQNMYDYLENPGGYVPGTAMSFAGLRDQEDRINIIAYMRSLSDDPIALPEPRAEEAPADAPEGMEAPVDAMDEAPAEDAAEG